MRAWFSLCLFALLACGSENPSSDGGAEVDASVRDSGVDTGRDGGDVAPDASLANDTAAQLEAHYETYGGRDAFSAVHRDALETLLYAEDEIAAGDLEAARERLDALLEGGGFDARGWPSSSDPVNVGSPVAYYGLRMVDQIVRLDRPVTGTLQMTAVVATCAEVSRPTLPDLEAEVVNLDVDPRVLADDARVLHQATALFRRWVQAISGLEVRLVVAPMEGCTTVTYTDDGSIVVSYPDANQMVESVSAEVRSTTNLWWVVAPSGVQGDGRGFGRHFITGGMSGYGRGQPLFLSDDAWFLRKPEHLGTGDYTDVERRAYHPQWFQHEFMHHLFRTWPDFGLEDTSHQWFDRGTWPADFVGSIEPDYYAEALEKRLLDATPSLAEALAVLSPGPLGATPLTALEGAYERRPVENGYHEVTVRVAGGVATWRNAAGASWALVVEDGYLRAAPTSPYPDESVFLDREGEVVVALWFLGERYERL
ncbi:MAG: hypothetical protein H6722_02775 [Sandaracinus sp.]|nr:hypothetical protein [Sandaracinus sp.]MCB9621806.1 hypothetical protein [Sandaracinus sp.]